jgi:hypothetical protein
VDKVKKTTLYRNNLTSLKRLKATQIAQKKAREVDLEAPRTARNKHERVQSKLYKGRERQPHQTSKVKFSTTRSHLPNFSYIPCL